MADRKPIRVLVCDDSLVAREMLTQILSSDEQIRVVGTAADGLEAVGRTAELRPDLVTMDIHMPKLDGVSATEQIMAFTPTPILIVSSSVHESGVGRAFDALSAGALEVMKKPQPAQWADLGRIGREIIRTVKILSSVRVVTHVRARRRLNRCSSIARSTGGVSVVAIGSSTGGPTALAAVLKVLPSGFAAPVVVAQHIAEGFVPGLVEWLSAACSVPVVAASDRQPLLPGTVYFAPTGSNLVIEGGAVHFRARAPRQLYVPSADDLLRSAAEDCGGAALGVLLTGMGADGALGLRAVRDAGGHTIAQDELTSVVWGMPRAAVEVRAAEQVLALEEIGPEIVGLVGGLRRG